MIDPYKENSNVVFENQFHFANSLHYSEEESERLFKGPKRNKKKFSNDFLERLCFALRVAVAV